MHCDLGHVLELGGERPRALDAEAVIEDALKNEARKKLEKKAGKLLNKLFDED